jgi:NAD+ synthase (glutamine-hydrolysing)
MLLYSTMENIRENIKENIEENIRGEIRLALAQINPVTGDIKGNANRIIAYSKSAEDAGADLVVFPELALSGYHPRDLLLNRGFLNSCSLELRRIREESPDISMLIGAPYQDCATSNAAVLVSAGNEAGVFKKIHMPGRGPLEEQMYFEHGTGTTLMKAGDKLIGVNIREDLWFINGPAEKQCQAGASLIINLSAWPFIAGRSDFVEHLIMSFAARCNTPVAFINMVGGSDELVFEGGSLVMGSDGKLMAKARSFVEDLLIVDVPLKTNINGGMPEQESPENKSEEEPKNEPEKDSDDSEEAINIIEVSGMGNSKEKPELPEREAPESMNQEHALYSALATALLDFQEKGGFKGALILLNGGIASALNTAIATDALGSESVRVLVPEGRWKNNALECAKRLGIKHTAVNVLDTSQRALGIALMEASEELGYLPLASITKTDLVSGGITLYGETAGLFAPLKDLWGYNVMELARWRNSMGAVIPEDALEAVNRGTPEDMALKVLVEDDLGFEEAMQVGNIGPAGMDELFIHVQESEHLRRQSPPGPKVTQKAVGLEWTLPHGAHYRL